MATRLNQVLTFTAVAAGGQATLAHALNINGRAVLPDLLFPDNNDFSLVAATTTTITVKNNGADPSTLNLWCLRQHTIDRAYGAASTTDLSPQPFWVGSFSGSGGGGGDVILLNGNAGVLLAGAPVYSSANGTVDKSRANAAGTTEAIGLVAQDPNIAIGASGTIRTSGPLTLTTAQWDAITGDVGGLTFNAEYWVDPATAGKLTKTAPVVAGQYVKPMGRAVSTLILIIDPEPSTLQS